MKFATKPIRHYPPHLRYVATLPRKIKKGRMFVNILGVGAGASLLV